jgi:hypothetical protein
MEKVEQFLIFLFLSAWVYFICCGCSWHNFAPTAGAGIGAGIGSIGGQPILGGLAGGAVGQIIEKSSDEDIKEKVEAFEALSKGEASKMIELSMKDQKGWIESTLDNLWDLLILCGIGFALWNFVPILYSRYLHKKQKEK